MELKSLAWLESPPALGDYVKTEDPIYVGNRDSIEDVTAERAQMDFVSAGDDHPDPRRSIWRLRELLLPQK